MTTLNVQPFNKQDLIEGLQTSFPNYKIQENFGPIQVRTSGFTLTGNVKINAKQKEGKITTQTNYDMLVLFLLLLFPLGIYIYLKKEKQKQMELEVVHEIKKIVKLKLNFNNA